GKNLRLRGVLFGPIPLLLKCLIEGVGVIHTLNVAAASRVPVPVPGSAHILSSIHYMGIEANFPALIQHVKTGDSGSDDGKVLLQDVSLTGPGVVGGGINIRVFRHWYSPGWRYGWFQLSSR